MSGSGFWIVYGIALVSMLIYRCVPLFLLKGKSLSQQVKDTLQLIAPCTFAALVAGDLFDLTAGADLWALLSAAIVVLVALKTKSLLLCALIGMLVYAACLYLL